MSTSVQLPVMPEPPEEAERRRLARDLSEVVEGEVRFDRHNRMLYATDASLYQVEPIGVVIPASIDDAERAARFCAQRGVAVLPRGGGTSLAGQAVNRAVVIDFSAHCRGLGDVDVDARRIFAEPGVVRDEMNDEIARRGHQLFFGPDTATSRYANIGGMIGNNSAGAQSLLYKRTVEHVEAIDALVLDESGGAERLRFDRGAATRDERVRRLTEQVVDVVRRHASLIRERYPTIVRRVTGYNLDLILDQIEQDGDPLENVNLAKLLCGSEGTLAVTLGAELDLSPTPVAKGLALIGFSSVREAIEAVNPILATNPAAVELLDDMVIDLARRNRQQRGAVELLPGSEDGGPAAALYVQYFAHDDPAELDERFAALREVVDSRKVRICESDAEMNRAWGLRKAAEPLLHGIPGMRKPLAFVEDSAVDPTRLPEFVERFRAIIEQRGTKAAFYAHASVGLLHVRPLIDLHDASDERALREIAVDVADLVREFGGALSAEHGDGRTRGPLLERYYGPELMRAFREIKTIFDPRNLLNPGNIVQPGPVESITTSTRVRPYEKIETVPDVETYFDYSDQENFGGAVEMCNGAGVCRKKSGGTMCPSYMALLDERHATRGRANALRLAITGQFDDGPKWDDIETIETLDLCLSCKACKTECPSNVDMARLKAEYTAQRYKAGGRKPLYAHAFSRIRLLNRLGSLTPGLAGALAESSPGRAVMNRLFNLAPKRSLPPFGPSLKWRLRKERARRAAAEKGIDGRDARPTQKEVVGRDARATEVSDRPRVALFVDCFTGFGESQIGVSAVRSLEALGYEVVLADAGCCARPAISLGLLEQAKRRAAKTCARLDRLMDEREPEALLFLEPSCLSSFRDDLLQLKMNIPQATRQRIAEKAMLAEDFIEARWENHPADASPRSLFDDAEDAEVIVHGHCHQKALWGAETSARLVRRLAGDRARVLDSGCCGMAGSFGFAAHRYDLSMSIGELTLLPAVRRAPAGSMIVAPGASCRHQILDGAGVEALHPMQVAERALCGGGKERR